MTRLPSFADSARLAATEDPDGVAVVDGDLRWTWRELDGRADAVAAGLASAGVAPGERVVLLTRPSAAAVAVLHGLARVGAVAAPLGTGLTVNELAAAAASIDPAIVVFGVGFETAAEALGRPMLAIDDLVGSDADRVVATPLDPDAPAIAVMTSGTTGRGKVVLLSTAALSASAEAWLAALPPATGWLVALGLGHVAGLGVVWRSALTGVPLVILARPDPAEIVAALTHAPGPSHVSVVPTTLVRILDLVADGPPPPTLRAVPLGGGPIDVQLVDRAIRAGWPIVPTFGLSEAGSGVTALPTAAVVGHPGTAGGPLRGVQVRIANPDSNGDGEIEVSTPARFSGYLGDPAATAAAFTEDGWLRTGDLGRLDAEGYLTVLDRRTDRIVRGGENISPAEVEAVLLDHPGVADAAVVARRDPVLGHVPIAAIVVRGDDPGDDALSAFCRARLAAFKVPAAFVRLDVVPRTTAGKLRRAELRATLDPDPVSLPDDRFIDRPGGVRLAERRFGSGPIHLLLLHGTLSTAGQLGGLARALAETGAFTVHAVDRRGSGRSRLDTPSPLNVAVHVGDLVAVLDAEGVGDAVLVGVSFGGVVALEFAARVRDRALAVVAYEPPYGPLADARTRRAFARVATTTERAYRADGAPAAAAAFMRGVAGRDAWDRLPDRARTFLEGEGTSAYVDAGLRGLDPDGLLSITTPTTILTGDASEPFYRPIAEAVAGRIPGARHVRLPGMAHPSPITDPGPIAAAVIDALAAAGVLPTEESRTT